ncbi:MAG: ATP-binding cassette domain-containing protein [Pirellulales bacterium]
MQKRFEIEGLRQRLYDPKRDEEFTVYAEQNITLYAGDFVSLLGPSGCGKTTLLSVLGLLRAPSHAKELKTFKVYLPDAKSAEKSIDLRTAWLKNRRSVIEDARRKHIGFALQSGELISSLSVRENIAAPLYLNALSSAKITERVDYLIDAFQLRRRLAKGTDASDSADEEFTSLGNAPINRLSGGEYQRTALARAIAHRPAIAFVDEPTSALNRELARGALTQLRKLQSDHRDAVPGVIVMITHDESFAQEFSNVIIRMAPCKDKPAGEIREIHRTTPIEEHAA